MDKITDEAYIAGLQTILRTIEEEAAAERSTQSFLDELTSKGQASNQLGVAQRQASAISTFAMPSDVESLLQFLAFCHGNAQMAVGLGDYAGDRVNGAWHGKAKMAFTQLKMKTIANPSLAPYIAEYEHLYGVMAKKPMSAYAKLLIGLVAFMVVFGTLIEIMASGESKDEAREKDRLDAIVQIVQTQIAARQYESAEAKCAEINWLYSPASNEDEIKQYDKIRESLLSQIRALKN